MTVHPTTPSPTCPFCAIAAAYPPIAPSSALQSVPEQAASSSSNGPPSKAFLILATQHVLAFLDIMPLSRGHILLTTRNHWEKVGDVGVRVGEEVSPLYDYLLFIIIFYDLLLSVIKRNDYLFEIVTSLVNGSRSCPEWLCELYSEMRVWQKTSIGILFKIMV